MALVALIHSIRDRRFLRQDGGLDKVYGDRGVKKEIRRTPMRLVFRAFVVDHGLRQGSDEEAKAVKVRVEALGRFDSQPTLHAAGLTHVL